MDPFKLIKNTGRDASLRKMLENSLIFMKDKTAALDAYSNI